VRSGGEFPGFPVETQRVCRLDVEVDLGWFYAQDCLVDPADDDLKQILDLGHGLYPEVDVVRNLAQLLLEDEVAEEFVCELVLENVHT
jgi:hypothetical protein